MEKEQIFDEFTNNVVEHLKVSREQIKITMESTFDELGFDSVDRIEAISYAEKHFGVSFTAEEEEQLDGVKPLVDMVYKKQHHIV
jgi:acyl carrier protein